MSETVMITLDLPATHRYLNVLSACIAETLNRAADLPAQDTNVYELQLAAQEVSANIVDHAYSTSDSGRIEIRLSYDASARRFQMIFTDWGIAYEGKEVSMPDPEDTANGGMGLFLIAQLVEEMTYRRQGTANIWQITKRLA